MNPDTVQQNSVATPLILQYPGAEPIEQACVMARGPGGNQGNSSRWIPTYQQFRLFELTFRPHCPLKKVHQDTQSLGTIIPTTPGLVGSKQNRWSVQQRRMGAEWFHKTGRTAMFLLSRSPLSNPAIAGAPPPTRLRPGWEQLLRPWRPFQQHLRLWQPWRRRSRR